MTHEEASALKRKADLDAAISERIDRLETGLLKMREIALECCRQSDVERINAIAKEAFGRTPIPSAITSTTLLNEWSP